MIVIPPFIPLFPYTTLFRSNCGGRESLGRFGGSCGANVLSALGLLCYTEFAGRLKRDDMCHNWIEPATQMRVRLIPDRKSTRLNSSHTVISYAVFCL